MRIIKLFMMSIAVVSLLMAAGCSCATKSQIDDSGKGAAITEPTPTPPVEPAKVAEPAKPVEAPPAGREMAEAAETARPELALKDVYYDFDKYDIKDSEKPALNDNADWMKANSTNVVVIEGHCDERGTVEYNLALGERRAEAAMNYLVSLGADGSKMKTISYGKSKPFADGHDEAAWALNRRAHFVVQR